MKMFPIILAIAAFGVAPALARIGETEEEIEKHYGKEVSILDSNADSITKSYSSQDFNITVSFWKGRSCSEMFMKKAGSAIPDDEITILLLFNSQSDLGILMPLESKPFGKRIWKTQKPGRIAVYDESHHTFLIATDDFLTYQRDQNSLDAAKKLHGF